VALEELVRLRHIGRPNDLTQAWMHARACEDLLSRKTADAVVHRVTQDRGDGQQQREQSNIERAGRRDSARRKEQ
jgi:hypothetical protein